MRQTLKPRDEKMDNHFNDFFKKRSAVSPFLLAQLYDTFMLVYVNRSELVFLIVFSFFLWKKISLNDDEVVGRSKINAERMKNDLTL